jgi:fructokinase
MMKRWKIPSALDLPSKHFGWDLEAHYIGTAVANYILCFSPERIIIGGGVMKQDGLIEKVRKVVLEKLNGYLHEEEILRHIHRYIVPPGLKGDAGVLGAVALAKKFLP